MLRSPPRSASPRLARPTPPGWLALQLWLLLGLVAPVLGVGGWVRAATEDAEVTFEHPLRGEAEDSTDSEDELRERSSVAALRVGPSLELELAAVSRGHLFADAHHGGPGSSHRGALHNRGHPVA